MNLTLRIRAWLLYLTILCVLACSAASADEVKPPQQPTVTVSGTVFADTNANGVLDAGEKGLSGVRVSDGFQIVRTDRAGRYGIRDVNPQSNRFVFVVTPSGWKNTGRYYRALPKDKTSFDASFGLVPCEKSASRTFRFAQITDIHVHGGSGIMGEDLAEIAGCKADFIVATGDLVNDGPKELSQLQTYAAEIKNPPVPIFNLPGNHDVGGSNEGPQNYESLFGPTYYSFDYGGCHFVMINSCDRSDQQRDWLARDLKEAGRTPILAFQHYHPSGELMRMLARHNALAIFTGHWHTTKVFPFESPKDGKSSVLYVNSPPLRFGGIDVSPRGFVLCYIDRGELRIEQRYGGVSKHLKIASPGEGSISPAGVTDIRVVGYDSGSASTRVEYSINNGSWQEMTQSGDLSWSAKQKLEPGSYTLSVRARFASGDPVAQEVKFTVSSSTPVEPESGDSWAMFRRDPARTGASLDSVRPPLRVAWSTALGGTAHGGGPAVVGDKVYVAIADENSGGRAGVYALNVRDGSVLWTYRTKSSIRNSVSVADGMVYAMSVGGEVVALDASTGKLRFTYQFDGVGRWLFASTVVKDGILYVGSGAQFVALDAKTGQRIWTAANMGGDWISCLTSPAVGTDTVLMGLNWSKGLYGLKRRTGAIRWNAGKGFGTSHCTPTIVGPRVYHAADSSLYSMDSATGEVIWKYQLPGGWPLSSPAIGQGRVVVGGPDGRICCVDSETGKELWAKSVGKEILFFQPYARNGNPLISSAAISGDVVYIGSGDGKLYGLKMSDGEIIWSYDLGVPITCSPAVSGNAVFVTGFDGTVYAFVAVGGAS